MKFRDANRSDLEAIVAIYNSTVAGRMVTADTEEVSVESRVKWFEDHSINRPIWVITDERELVAGFVSFKSFYGRPAYNGTAEISIYLHPAQRGKGLGKMALQHALDQCPHLKIKTVLGFIFAHNEPSLRLFTQKGFTQWALLPDIAELDGVERSLIILGKRVS